jgi:hypothetical protein
MNRPDPDFFWSSYEALDPLERLVIELKALTGGGCLENNFLRGCARQRNAFARR